jgi:hypothetical protein
MKKNAMSILVKVIVLQVLFLLLHYLYEWFPNGVTAILSGINESVYQHMKVAFFAYIFASLIEYAWLYPNIKSRSQFFHVRAFTAVIYALLVIVWFFASSAYFVKFERVFLEILFANLATILTSLTAVQLERHLDQVIFSRGFKWVTVSVFLVALSEFIIFTYRLPWLDVFANPPGW